jgi:hypothetical protein
VKTPPLGFSEHCNDFDITLYNTNTSEIETKHELENESLGIIEIELAIQSMSINK